jgi:signal transduction histidine kinase/CheY-like chemotaxis protein
MSLRARILAIVISVGIVSVSVLGYISLHFLEGEVNRNIRQNLSNARQMVNINIDEMLKSATADLELLRDLPLFSDYLDYRQYGFAEEAEVLMRDIRKTFSRLVRRKNSYLGISFYGNGGKEVVRVLSNDDASDMIRRENGMPLGSTGMEFTVLEGEEEIDFSQAYVEPHYGVAALKIRIKPDQRYPQAAIALTISIDSLLSDIKRLQSWDTFIVDGRGRLIYTTLSENRDLLAGWLAAENADAKNDVAASKLEEEYVLSPLAAVPKFNWKVGIMGERGKVYSSFNKLRMFMLGMIGVVIVFIVLFGWFLSERLSAPVRKVMNAIKSIDHLSSPSGVATQFRNNSVEFRKIAESIDQMVDQLWRMQKDLVSASTDAVIGRMSSHIAHDMRSPLSVLRSFVSMQKGNLSGDEEEYRRAADRSVSKLLHMADDLVDYAKASNVTRNRQSMDSLIMHTVIAETRHEADRIGAKVRYQTEDGIVANLDGHRIGCALVNLVTNALHAVEHGVGLVDIEVKREGGKDLVVTVADNGCGIEEEHLAHVFDSFFTRGKKKGTGLGLAYCKQVVEAHGGKIDIQSIADKGTTVTVCLPDCVVGIDSSEEEITEVMPRGKVIPLRRMRNVLIADDDADVRSQWKKIIADGGGRVIYAAESVEEVERNSFLDYSKIDTAIVDYQYEGYDKNGIDLIEYLKKRGVKQVYLCTGFHDDEEIRRRAKNAGADDIIAKPLDEKRLAACFQ